MYFIITTMSGKNTEDAHRSRLIFFFYFRIFYFGILSAATLVNACTSFAAYFVFWKRLKSGKEMYGGMKTDEILG